MPRHVDKIKHPRKIQGRAGATYREKNGYTYTYHPTKGWRMNRMSDALYQKRFGGQV